MCDAYQKENAGDKENERVVMKFKPHIAPMKAAVLPLMKKPALEEKANALLMIFKTIFIVITMYLVQLERDTGVKMRLGLHFVSP